MKIAESYRVLLLADQPFQLRLMSELAKLLESKNIETKILVTDLFTIIYAPALIAESSLLINGEIVTFMEEFDTWQKKGQPPISRISEARKQISKFHDGHFAGRDFNTVRLTDPYTNGFEFNYWYLNISSEWRDVAHSDISRKCVSILESFSPSLIISVDNCQFATNVMYGLSKDSSKFITFQNTRIGSRWVARYDFAIGSYLNSVEIGPMKSPDERPRLEFEIDSFINEFQQENDSLYKSPSLILGNPYRKESSSSLSRRIYASVKEMGNIVLHATRSVLLGPGTRSIKVRRFDQNHLRIQMFEAKRRLCNLLIKEKEVSYKFESSNYFLWSLHYRPEGSGLVLGFGLDEFVFIEQVAEVLKSFGQILVVKENPLMFGTRRSVDLKRLRSHSNLVYLSRSPYSKNLMRNAKGVIGVSGTNLLEAALLGIPSYAFGEPEYLPSVWSVKDLTLLDFVTGCLDGKIRSRNLELRAYLRFVFLNSTDNDSMLNALNSLDEMQNDIERMQEIVLRTLNS